MSRLRLGFSLLLLVGAILVFAPTIVFWRLFGFTAVVHHWVWVAYLVTLTALGIVFVFMARAQPDHPYVASQGTQRRLRLGMAAFGLVLAILVVMPTVVFGQIYGVQAVLAYWGSVFLLVAMTLYGIFLIFTAKGRTPAGS
jgi:hypothetical protein